MKNEPVASIITKIGPNVIRGIFGKIYTKEFTIRYHVTKKKVDAVIDSPPSREGIKSLITKNSNANPIP